MNWYRLFFFLGILLVVSACSEMPTTNSITVAGLMFYNNTDTPIHNAKLSVTTTRGLVACGVVLPGKECSTTFPVRHYNGDPVMVTWEHAGQTWSSGEVGVALPDGPVAATPTTAVITLGEQGAINAKLVPQATITPSPGKLQPQLR